MKKSTQLRLLVAGLYLYSLMIIIKCQMSCSPPDVPAYGKYLSKSDKFLPGDRVIYKCNEGLTLLGKEQRMCQYNGAWSDHTPFCDRSARLKNPRVTNILHHLRISSVSSVVDDNSSTCFHWLKSVGNSLELNLDEQATVLELKLFLDRGPTKVQILTGRYNSVMEVCANYERNLDIGQWVSIKCQNTNVLADMIKISSTSGRESNITVCEVKAFVKDEYGCDNSPDMRVVHGYFVVGRNKATLECEEGYRSENSRLICEGNSWKGLGARCEEILCDPVVYNSSLAPGSEWTFLEAVRKVSAGTRRKLKCGAGYRKVGDPDLIVCQKNGTWTRTDATCILEEKPNTTTRTIIICSIAVVVVTIIIVLLATTICLIRKQRHREVVVVYKTPADGSTTGESDVNYGSGHYETIQYGVPVPPNSPRPAGLPPVLDDKYILPEDYKTTLRKQPQPTPADIAFGTLKQSTLYGS